MSLAAGSAYSPFLLSFLAADRAWYLALPLPPTFERALPLLPHVPRQEVVHVVLLELQQLEGRGHARQVDCCSVFSKCRLSTSLPFGLCTFRGICGPFFKIGYFSKIANFEMDEYFQMKLSE